MNKPHIYLTTHDPKRPYWVCHGLDSMLRPTGWGAGMTPAKAYAAWEKNCAQLAIVELERGRVRVAWRTLMVWLFARVNAAYSEARRRSA